MGPFTGHPSSLPPLQPGIDRCPGARASWSHVDLFCRLDLETLGRMVTSCGSLSLYRKKINLSVYLAGQAVGIKEVDDGIWLVSFMNYDLGYIDLEEKTLQPLENPFGPKV